jgi:hypothetical protein
MLNVENGIPFGEIRINTDYTSLENRVVHDWSKWANPWESTQTMEERKVVAVDFDETISDHPHVWLKIMKTLRASDYEVVVVTWRTPRTDPHELQFLIDSGFNIHYTSLKAKKQYMLEQGIDVAIWIDDNPFAILNDAVN